VDEYTPPLLLGECGKIPVEVDHKFLAILVLLAYRLPELGETVGSTSPANRSQCAIMSSRYCFTLGVVAFAWSLRAWVAAVR